MSCLGAALEVRKGVCVCISCISIQDIYRIYCIRIQSVYTHTHTWICIYLPMDLYVHTYTHIYICIYIHIDGYTDRQKPLPPMLFKCCFPQMAMISSISLMLNQGAQKMLDLKGATPNYFLSGWSESYILASSSVCLSMLKMTT